jgi:hypothetical protein
MTETCCPASRYLAGLEGAVGGLDLALQLLQRHAIERQALRVRLDADFFRLLPTIYVRPMSSSFESST